MIRAAIFNDTRPTNHHGCQLVMSTLAEGLDAVGVAPVWLHPVREDWRERHDLPGASDIDVVIVNGEGSIHHSATRPRAAFLAQIGPWAASMGVPAFLINATVQAIDRETAAAIGAFSGVYVRETASHAELAAWGVDSRVCPDLTVGLEGAAQPRNGVAVTDSVLKLSNRALRRLAQERGWSYQRMVSAEPYEPAAALKRAHEFKAWIAGHELVVTGRFHTVTLCIATETPFVAVESNTSKISAFLNDTFGNTDRLVMLDELEALEPGAAVWSASELSRVSVARREARDATRAMLGEIAHRARQSERA